MDPSSGPFGWGLLRICHIYSLRSYFRVTEAPDFFQVLFKHFLLIHQFSKVLEDDLVIYELSSVMERP